MTNHKLNLAWEVVFDDGTTREIEFQTCYHFHEQKYKYLIRWMEEMIDKENITSKPVEIREKMKVEECEPYQSFIGL